MLLSTLFFASGAWAYGTIIAPAHRSEVGSAATAACGAAVADYIASHPTADVYDIQAQASTGFNSDACNINLCSGYQFADNTGHVGTIDPRYDFNVTVNYTVPVGNPPGAYPGEYYELYAPMLNLYNASSGYAFGTLLQYDLKPGAPQVLTWPNLTLYNYWEIGLINKGDCSHPGQCYLAWQLYDFFRTPNLVSQRIIDSGCVDVVYDWSNWN